MEGSSKNPGNQPSISGDGTGGSGNIEPNKPNNSGQGTTNAPQSFNKKEQDSDNDSLKSADDVVEYGIDDQGNLQESHYNLKEKPAPCECCNNGGPSKCTCGGPKDPVRSLMPPPPLPRGIIARALCKDKGPTAGFLSGEFPCCKCGRRAFSYNCTICKCVYCLLCHDNN